MDWNDLAGKVESINRWLRPLRHLQDIPEIIKAAQSHLSTLEEKARLKSEALADIDKAIEVALLDFESVDRRYQEAWQAKEADLTAHADARRASLDADLEILKDQLDRANLESAKVRQQQQEAINEGTQKIAQINQEIAAKQAELEEISQALAKYLKK